MMTPKTSKLQKSFSFATSWVGSLLLLFLFGCGGKNSGDDPSAVIEGNGFVILGTLTDQFDRAKAKANVEDTLRVILTLTAWSAFSSTTHLSYSRLSSKRTKLDP